MNRIWITLAVLLPLVFGGCATTTKSAEKDTLFVSGRIDGDTVDISSKRDGKLVEIMVREGVVGDQVTMGRDLPDEIAALEILGPLTREAPARHEEDGLEPAAIELLEDERRALQVGPVIEREQELARSRGGLELRVGTVTGRPERHRPLHGTGHRSTELGPRRARGAQTPRLRRIALPAPAQRGQKQHEQSP